MVWRKSCGPRTMTRMGSLRLPAPEEALPGRAEPMRVPPRHTVLGTPLAAPFPEGSERAIFGLGCFWGAERKFWQLDGVYTTAGGYCGLGGTGVSCPIGLMKA